MRRDIEKRLSALENRILDWTARLTTVDYGLLGDGNYEDRDAWDQLHYDASSRIAVYRNRQTREIRGNYEDRRSEEEILQEVGSLEYA